uniref:SUN domain-containing protein 1 n=1 Tax=Panagrellus redivivus TaxID=6233 RepID=A0A7E4VT28_PANRE
MRKRVSRRHSGSPSSLGSESVSKWEPSSKGTSVPCSSLQVMLKHSNQRPQSHGNRECLCPGALCFSNTRNEVAGWDWATY